jgi:hypothetical protein
MGVWAVYSRRTRGCRSTLSIHIPMAPRAAAASDPALPIFSDITVFGESETPENTKRKHCLRTTSVRSGQCNLCDARANVLHWANSRRDRVTIRPRASSLRFVLGHNSICTEPDLDF